MAKKNKETGVMNIILVILGIFLLIFTGAMVYLYKITGGIPDTLVTCVFAVCGCECGIMGMIKNAKEKYKDREWQKEDEKKSKAAVRRGTEK